MSMGFGRWGGNAPTPLVLVVIAGLTTSACEEKKQKKKEPAWGKERTAELSVGPYSIPIPTHWRALSDLHDSSADLPKDTIGMTPESFEGGAFRSNIIFAWSPAPAGSPPPICQDVANTIAAGLAAKASDVVTLTIDGDRACRWRFSFADGAGMQIVRFHGDHQLLLQWVRMTSLGTDDATSDKHVWDNVLTLFHVPTN